MRLIKFFLTKKSARSMTNTDKLSNKLSSRADFPALRDFAIFLLLRKDLILILAPAGEAAARGFPALKIYLGIFFHKPDLALACEAAGADGGIAARIFRLMLK